MMETIELRPEEQEAGQRLDQFLASRLDLSRSRLQKLISEKNIIIQGKKVKASYKVETSDEIIVQIPPVKELDVQPEDIPLAIFYEDDDLIVINKPQGMVVHPANGNETGTLVNALLFHCEKLSGIGGVARPGIVHRLDKDTSGLLVVAKSEKAHLSLAEQIKEHTTEKIYLTLVHGRVKNDSGTIRAPIGRHPVDRKKMAVVYNGKEAVTHYQVLEYLGDYTLVKVKLETGRTHQIRVHMAHIHHPVVCDPVYSKSTKLGLPGQFLHSHILSFTHPITGERMRFEAPLPEGMQKILNKLQLSS